MWVISEIGMFSVTAARENAGTGSVNPAWLQFRARAKGDLQNLKDQFELGDEFPIVETPQADYPYRIVMNRSVAVGIMASLVEDIDYTNFKSRVTDRMGHERHNIYMRVWGVLQSITSAERRNGKPSNQETLWGGESASSYINGRLKGSKASQRRPKHRNMPSLEEATRDPRRFRVQDEIEALTPLAASEPGDWSKFLTNLGKPKDTTFNRPQPKASHPDDPTRCDCGRLAGHVGDCAPRPLDIVDDRCGLVKFAKKGCKCNGGQLHRCHRKASHDGFHQCECHAGWEKNAAAKARQT